MTGRGEHQVRMTINISFFDTHNIHTRCIHVKDQNGPCILASHTNRKILVKDRVYSFLLVHVAKSHDFIGGLIHGILVKIVVSIHEVMKLESIWRRQGRSSISSIVGPCMFIGCKNIQNDVRTRSQQICHIIQEQSC